MKNILTAFLFVSATLSAFAQEEKVIIIDKGPSYRTPRAPKERKIVENNGVMKFSPLQMLVGEINFGYEKVIDDYSSVEFEFGPTLSNIRLTVNSNHYFDPYSPSVQETSGLGFFASAGYRFYPMDNGLVLNGFYVSPVLKYRLMNFGVVDFSENLEDTKGSENHLNFTFNFGYQTWLSERFSLDFFGGLGLSYESHIRYNAVSTYDGVTGLYSYAWDKNAYDGVRYLFTAGIKVGIGN